MVSGASMGVCVNVHSENQQLVSHDISNVWPGVITVGASPLATLCWFSKAIFELLHPVILNGNVLLIITLNMEQNATFIYYYTRIV